MVEIELCRTYMKTNLEGVLVRCVRPIGHAGGCTIDDCAESRLAGVLGRLLVFMSDPLHLTKEGWEASYKLKNEAREILEQVRVPSVRYPR